MKDLGQKIVVLTGAGSGIGRALACQLAGEKARLALCDIDMNGLEETKRMVQSINSQTIANLYHLDVSNREMVTRLADQVIEDFGTVDVVINNAGVASSGNVVEMTYETLEWTININMWGVIYVTKAFLPTLMQRPEASIVNVSSVFGLMGIISQSAYCASKFAVRGFTESLRQEMYNTNVAVTVVYPGGIRTNIAQNSKSDSQMDPEDYERLKRRFERSLVTPPDEAARIIIDGIKRKAPRVLIGKDARRVDRLVRWAPNSFDKFVVKSYEQLNK